VIPQDFCEYLNFWIFDKLPYPMLKKTNCQVDFTLMEKYRLIAILSGFKTSHADQIYDKYMIKMQFALPMFEDE